jgi:hypothetical protein
MKPLKHTLKAGKVFLESAGREELPGNWKPDHGRRDKALEREPQERWRLKEASKGFWSLHRREGSQTLRAGLSGGQVCFPDTS